MDGKKEIPIIFVDDEELVLDETSQQAPANDKAETINEFDGVTAHLAPHADQEPASAAESVPASSNGESRENLGVAEAAQQPADSEGEPVEAGVGDSQADAVGAKHPALEAAPEVSASADETSAAKTEPIAETVSVGEAAAEAEAAPEAEPAPETEGVPKAEAETQPDLAPEAGTVPEPEAVSATQASTEVKSAPEAKSKAEPDIEADAKPVPEAQPAPAADAAPEAKAAPTIDSASDGKAAPTHPAPKTEAAKTDGGAGTAGSQVKSGASQSPPKQQTTDQRAKAQTATAKQKDGIGLALAQNDALEEAQIQINRLRAEKASLYDQLLRRQAEFENFRKRIEREKVDSQYRLQGELLLELLPVMDSFDRALASVDGAGENANSVRAGLELIHRQLKDVLTRMGIEYIVTLGAMFDPNVHEAITVEPTDEFEENTIIQEFERGYKLGDRLLRPAKVKVAGRPLS